MRARHTMCLTLAVVLAGASWMPGAAQLTLPQLRRVTLPALDSLGPEKAGATVAISANGTLAFSGAFDPQDRAVTILDSAGRLLARLGPPGQGPGELSVPVRLAFAGGELVVVELAARRVSRFALNGSARGTTAMATPVFLAAAAGDSIDVFQFPTGSAPVLDFRRLAPATTTGRTLLAGESPTLQALAKEGQQQGAAVASIIYAAVGTTVVAANVVTYRLVGVGLDGRPSFDVRGRNVQVSEGETALLPIGGLQVDGRGRLWAVGANRETKRLFADIYSGSQLLGRIDLPCLGSVAITGAWLAILCDAPDRANRDVSLQVHRIIG